MKDFNGYFFDEPEHRKRMKYVIVTKGDLDTNNAYSFKSKKELEKYLKDDWHKRDTEAVFLVQDVSQKYL